ncbi:MAG: glutathione synthase [Pseudomonadota bacterium]
MMPKIIFLMDDLAQIKPEKDTTFALMLEAQRRGHSVWYANEKDLELVNDQCHAHVRQVQVRDQPRDWFSVIGQDACTLGADDVVFVRSDPPVDDGYIYATLLLDYAQRAGCRVINRPAALRTFNEKLAIGYFAHWMPRSLVSARMDRLREFVKREGQAVLKPLDGMGGRSIFLASAADANLGVILETLTDEGKTLALAQQFLPEIEQGDNRLLLINGRPVPYVLARIPGQTDFRGNLARGGRGVGRPINAHEQAIAEAVGPTLVEQGIELAGLDVIGDRLTEVNVTSPTCVRELDEQFGINIAGDLFDALHL